MHKEATWNPKEFMGEDDQPISRLAQLCMDNDKVTLPDGTYMVRSEGGFSLRNRNGHEIKAYSGVSDDIARGAAVQMLDSSAQSRHPESVGGHRRFANLEKVREGKSIDDRRPLR